MPMTEPNAIITSCKGCKMGVSVVPELQGLIAFESGHHGSGKAVCTCGTIVTVDVSNGECEVQFLIPPPKGQVQ